VARERLASGGIRQYSCRTLRLESDRDLGGVNRWRGQPSCVAGNVTHPAAFETIPAAHFMATYTRFFKEDHPENPLAVHPPVQPLIYRGASVIRKRPPLGPYSRPMPRALWWSLGVWRFLMSEVPLYSSTQRNAGFSLIPRSGSPPSAICTPGVTNLSTNSMRRSDQ